MAKKPKRRKSGGGMSLSHMGTALDLMLSGHTSVIGPDFIMTRRDPFNADIGHLNPEDLRRFDSAFVDELVTLKSQGKVDIPKGLKGLCETYKEQREKLSAYHDKAVDLLTEYDVEAAKELGNFDQYLDKVVIRNEAELNVLYDYISLYRRINRKRTILQWRLDNPKWINKQNKEVVTAFEKARFAVLRLDEDLPHGAIKTTDVITQNEYILMDRALNESKMAGCFFLCSILDREHYIMTSGAGIPIDPKSEAGKSTLTLLKKHLDTLRTTKYVFNNNIIQCVRELYGFCLRSGALEYMTVK